MLCKIDVIIISTFEIVNHSEVMADCFISYRRNPSAPVANGLQSKLKSNHGIDAYVDTTGTDATKVRFPERLMTAIADAPVFICLLGERDGQHTLESEWVLKEIHHAYNLQKFCIPVFQESYRTLPNLPVAVDYLLKYDGVHILDQKNIMIDESVRQIAELIHPQIRKRRMWRVTLLALLIVLVVGVFIAATQRNEVMSPEFAPDPLQAAYVPVTSNADWTPFERDFDGVPMVLVPLGCFMMGSNSGVSNEKPVDEQCPDEPFWIDKFEVTQGMYRRCLDAGVCEALPASTSSRRETQPTVNITWFQAQTYCEWRNARLPSEMEWEYAARGPSSVEYPWIRPEEDIEGNIADYVVYSPNSNFQSEDVGSIPENASWVGALDMSGNVWEWTNSVFRGYPFDGSDGREAFDQSALRVWRGGSWRDSSISYLRAAYRNGGPPSTMQAYIGFRCVHTIEQ